MISSSLNINVVGQLEGHGDNLFNRSISILQTLYNISVVFMALSGHVFCLVSAILVEGTRTNHSTKVELQLTIIFHPFHLLSVIKIGPLVLGSFGIMMKSAGFHGEICRISWP